MTKTSTIRKVFFSRRRQITCYAIRSQSCNKDSTVMRPKLRQFQQNYKKKELWWIKSLLFIKMWFFVLIKVLMIYLTCQSKRQKVFVWDNSSFSCIVKSDLQQRILQVIINTTWQYNYMEKQWLKKCFNRKNLRSALIYMFAVTKIWHDN